MTEWGNTIGNYSKPIILHNCHNYCASTFSGPTLIAAPCSDTDPSQQWELSASDNKTAGQWGYLRDAGKGLCVGCFTGTDCANTAGWPQWNTTGVGAGMQACVSGIGNAANHDANYAEPIQQFNYSATDGRVLRSDGACLEAAQAPVRSSADASDGSGTVTVVVQDRSKCNGACCMCLCVA